MIKYFHQMKKAIMLIKYLIMLTVKMLVQLMISSLIQLISQLRYLTPKIQILNQKKIWKRIQSLDKILTQTKSLNLSLNHNQHLIKTQQSK